MTDTEKTKIVKQIASDMSSKLNKGLDWEKFTMKGLLFQKMPENINKKGIMTSPSKLGFVFNPIINGKQSRKGKYFWDSQSFNAYVDSLVEIRKKATLFLKIMERVNPKADTVAKTTKSDFDYDI